ncbi:uncharacterized protein LOC106646751 [Copidosoma floridanum]|uniref:uncharacterized protein LOC106646751 n=1 Tax=Copidosoma floridanum TaxID=29053 RepID=UPI0006C93CE2|nr:uncharacterized protein LOC106646751 [Copidosoma floridanum]
MLLFRSNNVITSLLTNSIWTSGAGVAPHLRGKSFWSRFSKERNSQPKKCKSNVLLTENPCRRRVPDCPQFIDTGEPSKCLEEGYGEPIKIKKSWYKFGARPVVIKQKPTNCPPPPAVPPPEKRITFWEYLFGSSEKPLPDPKTCRLNYKYNQICNENDPRLDDPRYQETLGDVFIYSEPERLEICFTPGPNKPKSPPPHIPPGAVFCKKIISDSLTDPLVHLGRCACTPKPLPEPCMPAPCPIHDRSFERPYEELRPARRSRPRRFFTCSRGIANEDMSDPPRYNSSTCVNPMISGRSKYSGPPGDVENCEFHEALRQRAETIRRNRVFEVSNRKMTRCERLRLIQMEKERPLGLREKRAPPTCESRCLVPAGAGGGP